jgi:predicted deacylase
LKNFKTLKTKTITLFDFVEGHSFSLTREIAVIEGKLLGPNLVFIGGMHGNEPTGVIALNHVMREIKKLQPLLRGNVFALAGNLTALERGERFINKDLNRIWRPEEVDRALRRDFQPEEIINEVEEQIELWGSIDQLMSKYPGKFYFVDLHTTSVKSVPFALMSDTIMNRQFAKRVPVPVVIGVEEYLSEPLLSYVNELGCVSLAFEGGQHSDPEAVKNHEAMIWLSLVFSGVMRKIEVPKYREHYKWLKQIADGNHSVYHILERLALKPTDVFQMMPGFTNFQPVARDQKLAKLNGEVVRSGKKGLILMPLYQAKGEDGYFIVRRIRKFWLGVSFVFRKLRLYKILPVLPGVRRFMKSDHTMVVNTDVARWYSIDILHLMGYRRKKKEGQYTLFIRRKYDASGPRK